MELLLASFWETKAQVVVLEMLLLKEFKDLISEATVMYCPIEVNLCILNLRSKKGNTPVDMDLKSVKDQHKPSHVEKGEALMLKPSTKSTLMNFIICHVKGANSENFRRQL